MFVTTGLWCLEVGRFKHDDNMLRKIIKSFFECSEQLKEVYSQSLSFRTEMNLIAHLHRCLLLQHSDRFTSPPVCGETCSSCNEKPMEVVGYGVRCFCIFSSCSPVCPLWRLREIITTVTSVSRKELDDKKWVFLKLISVSLQPQFRPNNCLTAYRDIPTL